MCTVVKTTDQITLKDTPAIAGLNFRRFRGESDYGAMAGILNAAYNHDGFEIFILDDEVRNQYNHLQRCDPAKDMIVAEVEGQMVGFGRCSWSADLNDEYRYTFEIDLLPEWRHTGIPLAMAEFLQERLVQIADKHPAEAVKYFQFRWIQGNAWFEELMDELGFEPVRYGIHMVRPCSQPVAVTPLPAGIEILPISANDYRKVFDAEAEAFRDHWGYVPPTEADYQRWVNTPFFDPSLWQVAWEGDQVVGMVLNFIIEAENQALGRLRGYTEDISVRRPWRQKGIARALLTRSIRMFQEMGMDETCLAVDTENPNGALQLYASVGYKEKVRFVTYRAPMTPQTAQLGFTVKII